MAASPDQALFKLLRAVSPEARKLFCVIVREAYHGPLHPKPPGVATPAEIMEACGIDVAEFYSLLATLQHGRLIEVSGEYPFEEIRLTAEASGAQAFSERCAKQGAPLEDALVNLAG